MKKIVLVLLLLNGLFVSAQNDLVDAIRLRDKLLFGRLPVDKEGTITDPSVDSILSRHDPENDIFRGHRHCICNYTNDPFIRKYLSSDIKKTCEQLTLMVGSYPGEFPAAQIPSSLPGNIGNLDVTSFANGIAQFLVQRTKQEMEITFFERFSKIVNDPKYADVPILFPNTFQLFTTIDEEIYQYQVYTSAIKQAFSKDIQTLTINLPKVINNETYKEYFDRYPALKLMCVEGFYLVNGLDNKMNPGNIIEGIADADLHLLYTATTKDSVACKNLASGIELLKLISASFKDNASDHYWINPSILQTFSDPDVFNLYLGLLYEDAGNLSFFADGRSVSFRSVLDKLSSEIHVANLRQYRDFFVSNCKQLIDLDNKFIVCKKMNRDSTSFNTYYSYANSFLDFLSGIAAIRTLPGMEIINRNDSVFFRDYQNFVSVNRYICNLALDIKYHNYSSSFIDVFGIYTTIFDKNNGHDDIYAAYNINKADIPVYKMILKKEKQNTPLSNDQLAPKDAAYRYQKVERLLAVQDFEQVLLKYGAFMAAVSEAKSSAEVNNIIEAAALPPGSSRIKRESKFNICLNGYVGLYYGYEKIVGIDKRLNSFKQLNSYGLTAPVGISSSLGRIFHTHASATMFISLIDVGSIAAYRFKNDSIAQVPNIQLKDIISPGIFLSYGIPNLPISISSGLQIGPNLRNVTTTAGTITKDYSNNMYWRYSISACVDLPILNLYTRVYN